MGLDVIRADDGRILLITLSNIGDLVMTTPVLEGLHNAFPALRIDIVCDQRSSELLVNCPYRGDIFHRHKRAGWRGLLQLVGSLRRRHYELIVDLRTHALPIVLRCRRWVTTCRNHPTGPHAVQRHFATLQKLLGSQTAIPPTRVWFDREADNKATQLLHKLPGGRWLGVAPGANWPGKIWPTIRFVEMTARCSGDYDGIVILGSNADAGAAAELAARTPLPAADLTGRTGLAVAAAVLARMTAFVGNDSGLGHVAAANGVATLTVFGPGEPERYHPWGPRADYLVAPDRDINKLSAASVAQRLARHVEQLT